MEDRMNKPVDVICYGHREHFETRQEAIDKYAEGMAACEGSERERYTNVYHALVYGSADVVTDGSPERMESEPAVKFTLEDKDKIISLIEQNKLSVRSPELFDMGSDTLVIEDKDIIKALLKQDGWYAAQFLRKYIENDKDLILAVAQGGEERGKALCYASEKLQDDKEFVIELIKIDASDVRYVSDRLANDPEIISVALEHAETDYDINSIKEVLGKELLAEMVNSRVERYAIAKDVEIEDFKNALECMDCEFEGLSDTEIESLYDDFNDKLANDDTYSSIYSETAYQAFNEFMKNRDKTEVLEESKNSLADKIAAAESVKLSEDKANSKHFDVTITETLKMTVQVEADSLEDAEQTVSYNWHKGDYILDADNFQEVEFVGKPAREKDRGFDDRDER